MCVIAVCSRNGVLEVRRTRYGAYCPNSKKHRTFKVGREEKIVNMVGEPHSDDEEFDQPFSPYRTDVHCATCGAEAVPFAAVPACK